MFYTYNPKFGDYKECECGHDYHRHFDGYDNNEAVGCKYCGCYDFNVKLFNMMNEKIKNVKWCCYIVTFMGIHNKYYQSFYVKMTQTELFYIFLKLFFKLVEV
jgi:hypothetical protein